MPLVKSLRIKEDPMNCHLHLQSQILHDRPAHKRIRRRKSPREVGAVWNSQVAGL